MGKIWTDQKIPFVESYGYLWYLHQGIPKLPCNCRWPRWRNDTFELVSTGVHRRRGYVGRLMICEVDAIHALIPSYRKMIHGVIWRQLEQQSEIISEVLCMNVSFASKSARPRLKMTIPSQSFAFFLAGCVGVSIMRYCNPQMRHIFIDIQWLWYTCYCILCI